MKQPKKSPARTKVRKLAESKTAQSKREKITLSPNGRMDRLSTCSRMLTAIPAKQIEIGSAVPRNELYASVLRQACQTQVLQPDADFLIDDPSYLERPHDTDERAKARAFYSRQKNSFAYDAYPARRNFSSRLYFVLADLIHEGLLFNAHAIWNQALKPAFICRLTPSGIKLASDVNALNVKYPVPRNDSCFVIMSFSNEERLADFYRIGINAAVREAGYTCLRVDEIEHNRKITDLILHHIEAAHFIVADLTQARPNCYYELGWAHRAGKEVIPTIHADTPIHFDLKDYNFIVYESAEELHGRLHRRIIESIGRNAQAG